MVVPSSAPRGPRRHVPAWRLATAAAIATAVIGALAAPAIADPPSGSISDITAEATSSSGAPVVFDLSGVTDDNGTPSASCAPGSGMFPIGTTSVSCTFTDTITMESATIGFNVTVQDTTPPSLSLPATITVPSSGAGGTSVSFSATATDIVDGSVTVDCNPASSFAFPDGITTVNCSATDAHGNTASGSFDVDVEAASPPPPPPPPPPPTSQSAPSPPVDRTPPVISVPGSTKVTASGPPGSSVDYSASAVDDTDGPVPVSCSPASGTTFAIGATTVTCNAQDSAGNDSSKTFVVTVVDTTPPPPVAGLAVQAVGGHTRLRWRSPTSSDLDHIEIDRTRLPGGSALVLFRGNASSFTDVHAVSGVRYQYTVFTVDAVGNRAGVAVIVSPAAVNLVRPAAGASVTGPPVLLWVPVDHADYYNVQLYRDGTKVLSVWPTKASYRLGKRWRFAGTAYSLASGKYRWFVFPGFGPQRARHFGDAIGTSTFVVTR